MARNPKPIREFKTRANRALAKSKPTCYTEDQLAVLRVSIRRRNSVQRGSSALDMRPNSISPSRNDGLENQKQTTRIQPIGITRPDLVAERILEAWGVPKDAWKGLIKGTGAVQIQEIQEALEALMPIQMANEWMGRPSENPLFGGQPPMRKLLEPDGIAAIRRFVRGQLNIW